MPSDPSLLRIVARFRVLDELLRAGRLSSVDQDKHAQLQRQIEVEFGHEALTEPRKYLRVDCEMTGELQGAHARQVRIHNISLGGVCIGSAQGLRTSERVRLLFLEGKLELDADVKWVAGVAEPMAGLEFVEPNARATQLIASTVYGLLEARFLAP